ncbi:MAG: hypothetical protein RJA07_1431 [Bacteroidota bacterium]|jgi:hypothetical protein
MKKITLLFLAAVLFSSSTFAFMPADTGKWEKGGTFNLSFSETGYQNWATVTDDVVTVNSLLSLFAKYKKGKLNWENYGDFAYAQSRLSSIGSFRKSDDRMDVTSKVGYAASSKLFYTLLFNFKSQFAPGYTYDNALDKTGTRNSDFLLPAKIELSLGLDYKPTDYFSVFFSPLANRIVYCNTHDSSLLATYLKVRPQDIDKNTGKRQGGAINYRYEFGSSLKMLFQKDVMKNVNVKTRLEFFTDYLDNAHNVDVFGDLIISMKVNKYISASVGATVIYDNDVAVPTGKTYDAITHNTTYLSAGPRTQFRHTVGVGLAYKF